MLFKFACFVRWLGFNFELQFTFNFNFVLRFTFNFNFELYLTFNFNFELYFTFISRLYDFCLIESSLVV